MLKTYERFGKMNIQLYNRMKMVNLTSEKNVRRKQAVKVSKGGGDTSETYKTFSGAGLEI